MIFCELSNLYRSSTPCAEFTELLVKSSIVEPCRRTLRAIGFKRAPLQSGHSTACPSSSDSCCFSSFNSDSSIDSPSSSSGTSHTSPKPRQPLHHPCGELNENKRGSSSSNDVPQPGQLISVLKIVELFSESIIRADPCPTSSARTTRSFTDFFEPVSPMSASIECSLNRSNWMKLSAS